MIEFDAETRVFHLHNEQVSYLLSIEEGNLLSHLYFGERIRNYHGERKYPQVNRGFSGNLPLSTNHNFSKDALLQEYSGNNTGDYRTPAIIIRNNNGSRSTDFRYRSYEIINGKPKLDGLPSSYVVHDDEAQTLIITLTGSTVPLVLKMSYTIYENRPVITRNVELINEAEYDINIEKIASMQLDLASQKREVISLPGAHVSERQVQRQAIRQGILQFDSKRGTSSHQMNPFVAVVDPNTDEFKGEAIGVMLVYSGNHQITVESDQIGQTRIVAGINELNFDWKLGSTEHFQTPEVILAYSNEGLNGMSQAYHHLLRERVARGRYQYTERPIVINNWEATMFDFNEERIQKIVEDAQPLGVEMFVLDDGWFGHRDKDNSSLGDWHVDKEKLPHGLEELSKMVHDHDMQFGIWIEPEMISENSDLFRAHPDYALQEPNRGLSPSREQFVLDFSRPDIVENIYKQFSKVLDDVDIDYVKWDMNRSLSEVYSLGVEPDQEGEIFHRYVLGLYELMRKLTENYPEVLFEGCSGGGGRFDAGILYYAPQSWASDNTDPIARQKIQYGTSLAYPISSMTAHVSESPNQQTGRISTIETRGNVAMSGVLGYELDPATLSYEEQDIIKTQIEFYKKHRRLIQYGNFIRLKSPFDSNEAAWEFVNSEQNEVLLFTFKTLADARKLPFITKLRGLVSDGDYLEEATGQIFGGDELMNAGLYNDPKEMDDFISEVRYFKLIEE
ncbi:alpha-galactosidase [Pediococcus claussenii]|uniref:Alpha-galactosidase n=1 Tax=Pediococcus claussenii (strain ATCC BAA-344 / DSM 14800 / JCM 18046 / KCTC 3811 / LMG 21948 / P06) TaxID=701521 RepID=G8PB12_PEDCP|nr:alpha-galactosidase [Pediococcus claussenii]AEV95880.1 glycosyl hydrolases 31 family protein [Pediococcus claussenii ATCC BAA-344]ANZ69375.1 alpha-galactosidase [Pediococcus claussenii]ANZ71195.1 alpha-galactosidase [Pediococcus claussenii]KRN20487.1 hypothetical protein IV79_GL000542 [Pediococcus claussenii]